jgi:ATP-dependent RNA helicase RhlB
MKFEELNLDPRLLRAVADRGYTCLTEVQEKTLSLTLQSNDVAVQSQTGTGKTAAFLITLFEHLLRAPRGRRRKALIIVPTRELAVQIEQEAGLLNAGLGFAIGSLYGGTRRDGQRKRLHKGLDIMIGTPGRLLDFGESGDLRPQEIGFLVIDEADRLFDMGFLPDIRKLLFLLPPPESRQGMLFSATLDRASQNLAAEFLNQPEWVRVTPEQVTVEKISQELFYVKSHIKLNLMLGLLKQRTPRNALIFTNTRHEAFRLAKKLAINGYRTEHLTGDLPQSTRLRIMDDFKAGRFPFLVATDVAARGLDIQGLDMVINYDLPLECENYVHRIGRTARAGKSGDAVSFASEGMYNHLLSIEAYIGMKIPTVEADLELYETDASEGVNLPDRERAPGHRDRRYPRRDNRSGKPRSAAGTSPRARAPRKKRRRRPRSPATA